MKLTLQSRFYLFSLLLVLLPVGILGSTLYLLARARFIDNAHREGKTYVLTALESVRNLNLVVQEKLKADLHVARDLMDAAGGVDIDTGRTMEIHAVNQITKEGKTIRIPVMRLGGAQLAYNYGVVDRVRTLVGGAATIFQVIPEGILRISTNVMQPDGERAVGTYIPVDSPVYKAIIKGENYYGRAFVVNDWYLTAYEPIRDRNKKVIGALFVGVKEKIYQTSILDSLAKIRLGETGYLAVLDANGSYVLSYKRERDGENILQVKDSDGRFIIKEMLALAKQAKEGEVPIYSYNWKNKGEFSTRKKIGFLTYFAPWEWYIVMTAYEDEIYGPLTQFQIVTVLTLALVLALGTALSYSMGRNVITPIRSLSSAIMRMAEGDLSVDVEREVLERPDEIGVMSRNVKSFAERITEIVRKMKLVAEKLNNSSGDVMSSMDRSSLNMQDQSSSIEEISAAVEQLSAGMDSIFQNARLQKSNTESLSTSIANQSESIKEVGTKVQDTTTLTDRMAELVRDGEGLLQHLKKSMSELVNSSQKMSGITDIINGISEQINLLSLNASIEAARAGDQGRGFAVVASEVSKLADQTGASIKQIVTLIELNKSEIASGNSNTDLTVNVMEEIIHGVERIRNMMKEVRERTESQAGINALVTRATAEVRESSVEVQSSTEQQKMATDEISISLQNINTLIQGIAAEFEPLTEKARDLNHIAGDLKESVDYFRTT